VDDVVKVIQVLAPLLTVGLAVLGLLAWHWQLVAKRKFEIAEQAATVFAEPMTTPHVWSPEAQKVMGIRS
jgi:hypothetical protein